MKFRLLDASAMLLCGSLMISVALLPGCGRPINPKTTPAPIVKSIGKPLTRAECLKVGELISQAVADGDTAKLDELIDWDALNQTSTAEVDVPESYRQSFIQGLNQSRTKGKGFSNTLVDAVQQGGTFTLLHSHGKDDRSWLLFRLILPAGGVTYHDFLLARRPGGQVQATDIYVYSSGELLTQSFRRLFIQAAAKGSGGLVNKLTGADQKFARFIKDLTAMNDAQRAGKFQEVLDLYAKLPGDLKKDRFALMIRLQAAQNVNDESVYARAIEDFTTELPNDAAVDMMSIDYHLLRKEYPQALASVDRLDKTVLGDPYLETMRANVHVEQNDLIAARRDIARALEADPKMVDAYWGIINIALKEHNFDSALKTLRLIRDTFGVQINDLTTIPLYKDFVASPQYQELLKDQAPDPTATKDAEAKPER